jgi:hypothetical protein
MVSISRVHGMHAQPFPSPPPSNAAITSTLISHLDTHPHAEHEVWYNATTASAGAPNKSARAVLLFDVWHPDLTGGEIRAVQALLGEIASKQPEASGKRRTE